MKRLMLTLAAFFVLCFPAPANARKTQEKAVALQSFNFPKYYVRHSEGLGKMSEVSTVLDRREASFYLAPGLADGAGISFRSSSAPQSYLRSQAARLKLLPLEEADAYKKDATFRVVKGLANGSWKSYESLNHPGFFVRHKAGELWVERNDGTPRFAGDATFRTVAPPTPPAVQTRENILQKGFSLAKAAYPDVAQGNAGTCWILSSIAALQHNGYDLTKRIHYEGNNRYVVTLHNYDKPASRPAGGMHERKVTVFFDGKTKGADPVFNPKDPRSAWAVIMQRAVVLALHDWDRSQVIANPHSGDARDAMAILCGHGGEWIELQDRRVRAKVQDALKARKTLVFGTLGTAKILVGNHDYAVLGTCSQGLTLYNPHGFRLNVAWSVLRQEGSGFLVK